MEKVSKEKILKCAEMLLKNTDDMYLSQDLEYFIDDYSEYEEETDFPEMLSVITRICQEDFDISDFEFYDNPHPSVFCFCHKDKNKQQMFDVCVNYFDEIEEKSCIAYINDDNDECIAKNIPEAIEKFNKSFA